MVCLKCEGWNMVERCRLRSYSWGPFETTSLVTWKILEATAAGAEVASLEE